LLVILGAAVFAVAALANAPASFLAPALNQGGGNVQYQELAGRIWNGEVKGLAIGDQYLGDLAFRLRAAPLLTGAAVVKFSLHGGAAAGEGEFGASVLSQTVWLRDASMEFNLASVKRYTIFGIPYQGSARARVQKLSWSRRAGCLDALGDVWTNVLDASATRFVGDGLVLSGPASCENQKLRLNLSGANRAGVTNIAVAITPQMTYQLTASVMPDRADLKDNLRAIGFEDSGGALVYDAVGELKGAGS
jgi:hypothetical protein